MKKFKSFTEKESRELIKLCEDKYGKDSFELFELLTFLKDDINKK